MFNSNKLNQITRRQWLLLAGASASSMMSGSYIATHGIQANTHRDYNALAVSELLKTPLKVGNDAAGTEVTLQSYAGKPLLLNFWGTWCPPCLKEMPLINTFYRSTGRNPALNIVGLAVDSLDNVLHIAPKVSVSYPLYVGGFAALELSRKLGNNKSVMPHTVLISAQGRVVRSKIGEFNEAELAQFAQI